MRLVAVALTLVVAISACSDRRSAVDWGFLAEDDGFLVLAVTSFKPGCMKSQEVIVDEAEDSVEILVVRGMRDGFCTMELSYETLTIKLDSPLDGRTLTGCHLESDLRRPFFGEREDCNEVALLSVPDEGMQPTLHRLWSRA